MGKLSDALLGYDGPPSGDLFAPGARNTDPETSHAAARRDPVARSTTRRMVLVALAEARGGLTDFQLAEIVHRQQTSAGKRRGELRDLGLVRDTGERRPAPSGSPAIVWAITPLGIHTLKTWPL